ncbi:TetR/AcrR family transcriptional regulator [Litoribacillus peritrichatus]|uniref:TetR/AcrR family transcriptional regulator n=1 Tax=Litoribacillus peritrichatus TaxID=718191 RepID=A0ABP7N7V1_9GAMM
MVYRATPLTESKKSQCRERLLASGLKLVLEGGFSNLTISKVAQRAQVATGTMYRYFSSKGALCEDIFRTATNIELAKVTKTCQPPGTPTERMVTTLTEFAQRAIKGRRLAYALIAEPVDSMLDETRLQFRQAYAEQFAQLIQEGIECEEFHPQSPMISATAIVGAISEALIGPLSPENCNPIESQQLIKDIVSFCLRALATQHTAI